jgi:hypothetical protein
VPSSRDEFRNADQKVAGNAAYAAMLGFSKGAMLLAPAEDALDHRAATAGQPASDRERRLGGTPFGSGRELRPFRSNWGADLFAAVSGTATRQLILHSRFADQHVRHHTSRAPDTSW